MNSSNKRQKGASKYCVFGNCNSDSRQGRPGYDPNTIFYAFPKPCLVIRKLNIHDSKIRNSHVSECKHCKYCQLWVQKCKRTDTRFQTIADITKDTYICYKHFPHLLQRGFDHTEILPSAAREMNSVKIPSVAIKQEVNLDDFYQRECNEDYSITMADLNNFASHSSSFQGNATTSFCTVKDEPTEDDDSEATIDADEGIYFNSDALKTEILEPENDQMGTMQAFGASSNTEEVVMHLGRTEEEFNKLITTEQAMFCHYTGFATVKVFTELFDYIKDELLELDDVPKYCQLLAVLTKLHLNIDSFSIEPFKFPAIYVSVVNALHEQLKFMWTLKNNWSLPENLKKFFPKCGDGAIVGVLRLAVKSVTYTRMKFVQYLIGYTCHGKVFFASRYFKQRTFFSNMLLNCGIMGKMPKASWYIYRDGTKLIRCTMRRFVPNVLKPNLVLEEQIGEIIDSIAERFLVLNSKFPEYMLRPEGGVCFLDKLVNVSCLLHNMSR